MSYPVVLIIRIFLIFDLFISLRCNVAGETENEDDTILYLLRVKLQNIRPTKNTYYAVCYNRYKYSKYCKGSL